MLETRSWVVASSRSALILGVAGIALAAPAALGCTAGTGEGNVKGTVTVADCELMDSEYDLAPSFFGAEIIGEDLDIQIRRGSDLSIYSDGIHMLVRNVEEVATSAIGAALPVSSAVDAQIQMTLYLNQSCPVGDEEDIPAVLTGQSGAVTFTSIYAPTVDEENVEIAGTLSDIYFADDASPDTRHATLSGDFSFFYNRGRPAQRFP